MLFSEMSLPATLQRALATRGYLESTPVQEAIVTGAHGARDLLVSSKTGSGKTIAFGLNVIPPMLNDAGLVATPPGAPRALIIAPTRELAQQVAREITWLGADAKLRVVTCVGGVDPRSEQRALFQGCHVVVGTPGRLVDHITRKALDTKNIHSVVLDEADEMLDMGFREELETILDAVPTERQILMFSATMPRETIALANRYTKDAVRVSAAQASAGHEDIETVVHVIAGQDRDRAVVNVLRQHEATSTLVFCGTRDGAAHLAATLIERGFSAVAFSGELSQPERQRALQSVRDGRTRVLVCTDVAARGLDLPAVGLVIHADPPADAAALQHRSGRTGRAGKKGTAVVLVPVHRLRQVERLFAVARLKTRPSPVPNAERIRELDAVRVLERLKGKIEALQPEDLTDTAALLALCTPEQLAALVLQGERSNLPDPESLDATERGNDPARAKKPTFAKKSADDLAGNAGDDRSVDGNADSVWFHVNIGRFQNADPKWLLPMICRRGAVEKRDIGRIVILDSETRFEIAPGRAEQFGKAASQLDEREPRVFIRRFDPSRAGNDEQPARRGPPPGPPPRQAPRYNRDATGPAGDAPPRRRPAGDGGEGVPKRKIRAR